MKKRAFDFATIGLLSLGVLFMVSCSKEPVEPTPGSPQNVEPEYLVAPVATFDLSLSLAEKTAIIVPLMNDLDDDTDILMTPNLSTGDVIVTHVPRPGWSLSIQCAASIADDCHHIADVLLNIGCSVSGHMGPDGSVYYDATNCPQ